MGFEMVDTPTVQPREIKAGAWKQAGCDVLSTHCPYCDAVIHLSGEGCVICRCGAYLRLVNDPALDEVCSKKFDVQRQRREANEAAKK